MYNSTTTPALNGAVTIWPIVTPMAESVAPTSRMVTDPSDAVTAVTISPTIMKGAAIALPTTPTTSTVSRRMPRTRQKP
ncbi:Uncharacterised protein [Mycobacterium tuberculosis]|uniref:Uncharacterized protein n=2 Tax=Mycobacterium tuberculosis TaxID=1773 RepID=A0A655AHN4_MYCTX|nr:Uncharacterised protein [Mycobacterium tuberculosis]CKT32450.1 Uncharacterised protein [Mycobacterium tuberculosis]CNW24918.1 Uncharacterised protein [Mycobacterium tuberculosis]COW54480.1 Uncharacterised protein [Mycobacterium tuberculosis]COZ23109.1 Uncharacterised protein [Mycobacterium tuberculosis]